MKQVFEGKLGHSRLDDAGTGDSKLCKELETTFVCLPISISLRICAVGSIINEVSSFHNIPYALVHILQLLSCDCCVNRDGLGFFR